MLGGMNEKEEVSAMSNDNNKIRGEDFEDNKEVDSFYEKLTKMNESSGLTLVFNFRQTILDLYLAYKQVTQRGGFNQVTMDRKWDEVAYSLNLNTNDPMLSYQLQMLYRNLLYPYEQTQHYRTSAKTPSVPSNDELDSKAEKRKRTAATRQQESSDPETPEQKKTMKKPQKEKESKKEPNFPVRPCTSYQFFLRLECDRLKKLHGESTHYVNLRTMASDKWKQFSESEKQPFIEASKADKERFLEELVTYKMQQDKQEDAKTASSSSPYCNVRNFYASSETERDYHVLPPESGDLITPQPIEPLITELAEEMMMRAYSNSTDHQLNINVDEYNYGNFKEPPT